MTLPSDLERRASALIGAPFKPLGGTPDGWDCRGLVRWCLTEWADVTVPDYLDVYDAEIVTPEGAGQRQALFARHLASWRQLDPQAGAVALLERFGRAGHIGFMLSPTRVLHADAPSNTAILDLTQYGGRYRLRAAFIPAHIKAIRRAP